MTKQRKISVKAVIINKETGDEFIALDKVFTEKVALRRLTRIRKEFESHGDILRRKKQPVMNKLVVTTAVVFPEPKKYFI